MKVEGNDWKRFEKLNAYQANDLMRLLNRSDVEFKDGKLTVSGTQIPLSPREQHLLDSLLNDPEATHLITTNELMHIGGKIGEWENADAALGELENMLGSISSRIEEKTQSGPTFPADMMSMFQNMIARMMGQVQPPVNPQNFMPMPSGMMPQMQNFMPGMQPPPWGSNFPQFNPHQPIPPQMGMFPQGHAGGFGNTQMMMMVLLMTVQSLMNKEKPEQIDDVIDPKPPIETKDEAVEAEAVAHVEDAVEIAEPEEVQTETEVIAADEEVQTGGGGTPPKNHDAISEQQHQSHQTETLAAE